MGTKFLSARYAVHIFLIIAICSCKDCSDVNACITHNCGKDKKICVDCADLPQESCNSILNCSWNSTSCVACSGLPINECTTSGCWYSKFTSSCTDCKVYENKESCFRHGCGFTGSSCTSCKELQSDDCTPETGCNLFNGSCMSCEEVNDANWEACLKMDCGFNDKGSCISCSIMQDARTCVMNGCGMFGDTCESCSAKSVKEDCEKANVGCVWENEACLPLSLECSRYTSEANCRASASPCYWKNEKCVSCTEIKNPNACNSNGCSYIDNTCSSCGVVEPGNDGVNCYSQKCGFDTSLGFCVSCTAIDSENCTKYKGCALSEGRCEYINKNCSIMSHVDSCLKFADSCGWNGTNCVECSSIRSNPNAINCAHEGCGYDGGETCVACSSLSSQDGVYCHDRLCGFSESKRKCQSCHFKGTSVCLLDVCDIKSDSCVYSGEKCASLTTAELCVAVDGCIWDDNACKGKNLPCRFFHEEEQCKKATGCGWKNDVCINCNELNISECNNFADTCSWCSTLLSCQWKYSTCWDCNHYTESPPPGCIDDSSTEALPLSTIILIVVLVVVIFLIICCTVIFVLFRKREKMSYYGTQIHTTPQAEIPLDANEQVIDIPEKQKKKNALTNGYSSHFSTTSFSDIDNGTVSTSASSSSSSSMLNE